MPSDNQLYIPATIEQARIVANILCKHPYIYRVECFGSVMRDGVGADIDLIIVTDETRAMRFQKTITRALRRVLLSREKEKGYKDRKSRAIRFNMANKVLGTGFSKPAQKAAGIKRSGYLDIFLFPPDWRNRLEELQNLGSHSDSQFMWNVATEARILWPK